MSLDDFMGGGKKPEGPGVRMVECKSALSPSRLPGLEYSLNPYRGCMHGCVYCYAPCVVKLPRKEWGSWVEARSNIPRVLDRELHRKARGVVGLSTVTDPYQRVEERFSLTRYCLEVLSRARWPVSLHTKSDLIVRDIGILEEMRDLEVSITICSLDAKVTRALEPGAPSPMRRLEVLRKLSDAGISVGVFFGPMYPILEAEAVEGVIHEFKEAGAHHVLFDSLHQKPGVRESVLSALESLPEIYDVFESRMGDEEYWKKMGRAVYEAGKELSFGVHGAF